MPRSTQFQLHAYQNWCCIKIYVKDYFFFHFREMIETSLTMI